MTMRDVRAVHEDVQLALLAEKLGRGLLYGRQARQIYFEKDRVLSRSIFEGCYSALSLLSTTRGEVNASAMFQQNPA